MSICGDQQQQQQHRKWNLNNMMTSDIKCFQHCKASERYLCFDLPDKCPACEFNLFNNASIKFKVPPFVVPRPLKLTDTRLKCLPAYSLLLQPTDCDYRKLAAEPDMADLHIGVTNSDSDVFDFNQNGLNKNAHNWIDTPSIVIEIKSMTSTTTTATSPFTTYDESISSEIDFKWNMLLDRHWKRRKELWNRRFYDENRFNCLDFVVGFLLEYGLFELDRNSAQACSVVCVDQHDVAAQARSLLLRKKSFLKHKISKEFIEPEFDKCLGYLRLLLSLHEKKYIIEKI